MGGVGAPGKSTSEVKVHRFYDVASKNYGQVLGKMTGVPSPRYKLHYRVNDEGSALNAVILLPSVCPVQRRYWSCFKSTVVLTRFLCCVNGVEAHEC